MNDYTKIMLLHSAITKYYSDIQNYCRYHLSHDKNAAEECTQDTFSSVLKHIGTINDFTKIRAYFYRTADNYIKRYIKMSAQESKYISCHLDDDRYILPEPSYEENLTPYDTNAILAQMISKIFNSLTENDRKLYQAFFLKKKRIKVIAVEWSVSEDAIKVRLCRLRKKIKFIVHQIANDG